MRLPSLRSGYRSICADQDDMDAVSESHPVPELRLVGQEGETISNMTGLPLVQLAAHVGPAIFAAMSGVLKDFE